MRIYRYILGVLATAAIVVALGVVVFGISRSDFYASDIPYSAGLLFCVYIFLQYMFLIKFGFYNQRNAEHYNKRLTIGLPVLIVLLLAGFIGFRYQSDFNKRKRRMAQEQARLSESTSYLDFYNLFDYPQQLSSQLAVKFLKIDPQYFETDTVWTVSRHSFSEGVRGLVYKTRNHRNERITLATFIGNGTLVDKIEIGHTIYTPVVQNTCQYEINQKQIIELRYQEVRKLGRGKASTTEVKRETYLVNDNTGELRSITGQFD